MRKPIQIAIFVDDNVPLITALCDDGSIWQQKSEYCYIRKRRVVIWEEVDDFPKEEF